MNTFEKHGITYLSASTINQWVSQPALCLLKIAGITDSGAGPAAWRGTGADRAITKAAFNPDINEDDLIQTALDAFDEQHKNVVEDHDQDKIDKERKAMIDYVRVGSKFYASLPDRPIGSQGKIITKLDEIEVPFIGYYDLSYETKVRDIKTSAIAPNKPTAANCRQLALYGYALNLEPHLDYINRKEVKSYPVPNVMLFVESMRIAALSLKNVLAVSDDIFECCKLVYPDIDHWMWGETTKAAAYDIWKVKS